MEKADNGHALVSGDDDPVELAPVTANTSLANTTATTSRYFTAPTSFDSGPLLESSSLILSSKASEASWNSRCGENDREGGRGLISPHYARLSQELPPEGEGEEDSFIHIWDHGKLDEASRHVFDSSPPKKGVCRTITGWYSPVMTAQGKRYCNRRLKTWQFILVNIFLIYLLLSAILYPIAYFVIIPRVVQDIINAKIKGLENSGQDNTPPPFHLDYLNVTKVSHQEVGVHVKATLPPQFPLPVIVSLGECSWVVFDQHENRLIDLQLPELANLKLNVDIPIEVGPRVNFQHGNKSVLAGWVKRASVDGSVITARSTVPIYVFGWPFYSGLPLYVTIDLGKWTGIFGKASSDKPYARIRKLIDIVKADSVNTDIRKVYRDSQLINSTALVTQFIPELKVFNDVLPDLHLDAIEFASDNSGPMMRVQFAMSNPTNIFVAPLHNISIAIGVNELRLLTFSISSFALGRGLNLFDITFKLDIAPEVELLSSMDLSNSSLTILGPLSITDAQFLPEITAELRLNISLLSVLKDIVFSQLRTNSHALSQGMQTLLNHTEISIQMQDSISTLISTQFENSFPLPAKIEFPFHVQINLCGLPTGNHRSTPFLSVNTNSVNLYSNVETGSYFSAGLQVVPVNSAEAAQIVAGVFNPLFALSPKDSAVWVVVLVLDTNGNVYPWSQHVKFSFPLPSSILCTKCLVDMLHHLLTDSGLEHALLPESPVVLLQRVLSMILWADLTQTENEPGFHLRSGISLPTFMPVQVQMGYVSVDMLIDGTRIITPSLPNGLSWNAKQPSNTVLDAKAVLSNDGNQMVPALLTLVHVILEDGHVESRCTIGLSRFMFGPVRGNPVITFSQVEIELLAEDVVQPIKSTLTAMFAPSSKIKRSPSIPPVFSITSFGLSLTEDHFATVIGVELENLTPFSVNLGSPSARVLLDSGFLADAHLPALNVKPGKNSLNLSIAAYLSKGGDGMAHKFASLLHLILPRVVSKSTGFDASSSSMTVVLTKIGLTDSEGITNSAIHQFEGLKIESSITYLANQVARALSYAPAGSTLLSTRGSMATSELLTIISRYIDVSRILPRPDEIPLKVTKFLQAKLSTLPDSLETSINAEYSNNLAIALNLPGIKLALSAKDIISPGPMDVQISSFQLLPRNSGKLVLDAQVSYVHMNAEVLYEDFMLIGPLRKDGNFIISGVEFGHGNGLLSDVEIDVYPYIPFVRPFVHNLVASYLPGPVYLESFLNSYVYSGLIFGSLAGTNSSSLIRSAKLSSFEMKPSKTIEISGALDLNPLPESPVKIMVKHSSVTVGLSANPLIKASLPAGLRFGFDEVIIALFAAVTFEDTEQTKHAVEETFHGLVSGSYLPGTLDLNDVQIGPYEGKAFSIRLPRLPLRSFIIPGSLPMSKLLTTVIDAVGYQIHAHKIQAQSARILRKIHVQNATVDFRPSHQILTSLTFDAPAIFFPNVNLPLCAVSLDLDSTPAFSIKSSVNCGPEKPVALGNTLQVFESDALASKMVDLSTLSYSGDLNMKGIRFGFSETDSVNLFSSLQFSISFPALTSLVQNILPLDSVSNSSAELVQTLAIIFPKLNLTTGDVVVKSAPGSAIESQLALEFANPFPLTISGLSSSFFKVGIDQSDMLEVEAKGLALAPGLNSFNFSTHLQFHSSDAIQDAVALFAQSLQSGQLFQNLALSGLRIQSKHDSFDFLSKARFLIPKEMTLRCVNYGKSLIPKDLVSLIPADPFSLGRVETILFDASAREHILFGTSITIFKSPITVTFDIGFCTASPLLNGLELMTIRLDKGISLLSKENQSLSLGIETSLVMNNAVTVQENMASLVMDIIQLIQGEERPFVRGSVGVSKLLFGYSPADYITTFSKIFLDLSVDHLIDRFWDVDHLSKSLNRLRSTKMNGDLITEIQGQVVGAFKRFDINFSLEKLDMDIHNASAFVFDIAANLSWVELPTLYLHIPHFQMLASVDNKSLLLPSFKDIKFKEGQFTSTLFVSFMDDLPLIQKVFHILGDIIFHRPNQDSIQFDGSGIEFGHPDAPAQLMSKVKVALDGAPLIVAAQYLEDHHNPLAIHDIQAVVREKGVLAFIELIPLPIGITTRWKEIKGQIQWRENFTDVPYIVANVKMHNITIKPGQLTLNMDVVPDLVTERGCTVPFKKAVVNLLQFKNYAEHAYLGSITITGESGQVFNIFREAAFHTLDLYMWRPISVNVQPAFHLGSGGMRFIASFSFPNPGPLHLELGELRANFTHKDKVVLKVAAERSLTILNVNEGGNDRTINPKNGNLTAIIPWGDLNPLRAFTALHDMFTMSSFDFVIGSWNPEDGYVKWLSVLASSILDQQEVKDIVSGIAATLSEVNFKLFGFALPLRRMMHAVEYFDHAKERLLGLRQSGLDIQPRVEDGSVDITFGVDQTLH